MAQTPDPSVAPRIKAYFYRDYGSPEVLRLEEIEKPVPTDDQVLVKVRAASVNPLDWHYMEGTPYIVRAMEFGLLKPKIPRLGVDHGGPGGSGGEECDGTSNRAMKSSDKNSAPLASMSV